MTTQSKQIRFYIAMVFAVVSASSRGEWTLSVGCSSSGTSGSSTFSATQGGFSGSGTCSRTPTAFTKFTFTTSSGGTVLSNTRYGLHTGDVLIVPPILSDEVQPIFSVATACPASNYSLNWLFVQWAGGARVLNDTYVMGSATYNTGSGLTVTAQYDIDGSPYYMSSTPMPGSCSSGVYTVSGGASDDINGSLFFASSGAGVFKTAAGNSTFFLPQESFDISVIGGKTSQGITFDSTSADNSRPVRVITSSAGDKFYVRPFMDPETAHDPNWSAGRGFINTGHSTIAEARNDDQPCESDAPNCLDQSHADFSKRRVHMLNSGAVIWDLASNVSEWVSDDRGTSGGTNGNIAAETWSAGGRTLWGPYGSYTSKSSTPFGGLGYAQIGTAGGAIVRGGNHASGANAGIFATDLSRAASYSSSSLGFRCVYTPNVGQACPSNYTLVRKNTSVSVSSDFCVAKYEMKIQGESSGNVAYNANYVAESRASGTPWVNITRAQAISECQANGARYGLISNAQWQAVAREIEGASSEGTVDMTDTGYVDTISLTQTNFPRPGMMQGVVHRSGSENGTGNIACIAYQSFDSRILCSGQSPVDNSAPYSVSFVVEGSCPTGYAKVPANSDLGVNNMFCVAKYEAKQSGSIGVSVPEGLPWVTISRNAAITACQLNGTGYDLITNAEWQTMARNIENAYSAGAYINWLNGAKTGTNRLNGGWAGSTPNSIAASSDDSNGCFATGWSLCMDRSSSHWAKKRTHTLSNGEVVWDVSGNVWDWVKDNNSSVQGSDGYVSLATWTGGGISNSFGPSGDYSALNVTPYGGLGQAFLNGSSGAIARGGNYATDPAAGVFATNLYFTGTQTSSSVGFRCVYHLQ